MTRIVFAPNDAVEALRPFVDEVIAAIEDILRHKNILITDESLLSDMFGYLRDRTKDHELYVRFSEKLGIVLDPDNEDDNFIVKIARRLKLERGGGKA